MPKPTIKLDEKVVQKIVTDLESKNTYTTRSKLFEDVLTELMTNHGFKKFSPAVISQRVNNWTNFQIKTAKGKRGQALAGGNVDALKKWRESGGESVKKKVGDATELVTFYVTEEQGKYLKMAKSIKRGSLKAAVKLMCLQCSTYEKKEITLCPVTKCPLHPVRPYQNE